MIEDITAALEYADQIEALLEAMPFFYLRNDPIRFTHCNGAMREFLGVDPRGAPVAWWMDEVVHPEDVAKTRAYFTAAMQHGGASQLVNRIRGRDGLYSSVRWYVHTDPETNIGLAFGVDLG